jgi:Putative Ig domain
VPRDMKHVTLVGLRTLSLAVAALALGACGGGGDSDGTAQGSAPPPGGNNAPPTIQGSPATSATAGQAYSFQPTAADPNGDALTFSVTNLPPWASFNTSTGRVSGTPSASDIATYSNIRISVSDGQVSAALTAFSISVTQFATGSVTLSWTPPTQNADGSALTNLAGYQVLYGRSQNQLDQMINLDNASLNRYVVENLAAGTWFFAVVAVNTTGTTSDASNLASRTIS